MVDIIMCLATPNQFVSVTARWRHLCNRHIAHHIVLAVIIFWCLYGIPYLIFYDVYVLPTTGLPICGNTNSYLAIYISRVQLLVLQSFLPIIIQIVFGVLIWINLYGEMGRRAPIVRLRRDKQLTAMVRAFLSKVHFVYFSLLLNII